MAHMVGASVGQPGRQTGGLSMHLELSTDRAWRQGCSGHQPASHTYATFMLLSILSNLFTNRDSDEHCSRASEISLAIKCVLSRLQGSGTVSFI